MSFKHNHSLNPILALEFYHTSTGTLLILAAEGPFLKIFDAESSKLVSQCRIFDEQAIHGLIARDSSKDVDVLEVVIWGGSYVTLLSKFKLEELIRQDVTSITEMAELASDWILSVAFCTWERQSCVMITAHNAMLQATIERGYPSKSVLLKQLHPPSRSMLYSASLICENEDTVIVAAGTIFGEIIVWKCIASQENTVFLNEVLFVFTGHEGSIFGVDISPIITGKGGKSTRLLASCSDDRTIRIWNLTDRPQRDEKTENLARELMPRETGFGGESRPNDGNDPLNRCVAQVMAHASRIWGVKFLCHSDEGLNSSPITVLSFGEDATTQQWSLQLDPRSQEKQTTGILEIDVSKLSAETPAQLTHVETFAFNSGKHIWSAAVTHSKDNRSLLATGGHDGKISTYTLNDETGIEPELVSEHQLGTEHNLEYQNVEGSSKSFIFELEDVLKSLAPSHSCLSLEEDATNVSKKKVPKDAFNRYAFVSEDVFVITTTSGRVLKATIDGSSVTYEALNLPESSSGDLKSYSVLKAIPEIGLCFLAGTNGKIFLYHLESSLIKEIGQVDRKPSDIFIISRSGIAHLELAVSVVGTQELVIFPIYSDSSSTYSLGDKRALSLPQKFVVTAAGSSGSFLVLGSRDGHMCVHDSDHDCLTFWDRKHIGTNDAITSIVPLPGQNGRSQQMGTFVTTSRDGNYAIFSLSNTGTPGGPMISCIHRASPPFGPLIEACWFQGPDLILYGFKSKSLVVWNESKQSEIMRIECGGAHRAHAYSALKDEKGGGSGHLVYTKASKLYLHSQNVPSHRTIKPGGHGREIKACDIGPGSNLIATGAEDTNIRLWRYHESGLGRFECHAVIQKHTAGIQHLQWHGSSYLFSSGGVEEFYVWAIQDIPGFGIGVVCEASSPDPTEEQDLRIMGFDVSEAPGQEDPAGFLISLAYSDSTIRTYFYSKVKGFKLLVRGQYTSACLTKIHHLRSSRNELYLLTAATDGSLCIWRASLSTLYDANIQVQEFALLSHQRVHQSAIKSLDIRSNTSESGDRTIVATGGDDNALGITIYTAQDLSSSASSIFETKPETIILRSAHAAAVTGLSLVSDVKNGQDTLYIVSSSTDQRVKTWKIKLQEKRTQNKCPISIEMTGDEFTSVSDIGDVAILDDGESKKAVIVGHGMDVWSLEK